MDQRTLDKILDYNRLKQEQLDLINRTSRAKQEVIDLIAEIADKAGLSPADIQYELTPF
jgi:hypothetical protein